MITVELARRLRDVGLVWTPASGDRFAIPDRLLDDEVFVVSDMSIDTVQLGPSQVVRFQGTTEWALDSMDKDDVVWLPHEAQLRALLGPAFRSLTSTEAGYAVEVTNADGKVHRQVSGDAECAYALALLDILS
ncbi:hypothetical protein BH18ACT9_BH18ACT9_15770 [soil metagenome]